MATDHLLRLFNIVQIAFCLYVMCAMMRRHVIRTFPALTSLLALLLIHSLIRTCILFYRSALHIPKAAAYSVLFTSDTCIFFLELCLLALIIYGVFLEAMRPFPGLQRVGQIVFRWVGAVALLVALALSTGPQLFVEGMTLKVFYTEIAPRFQQGINVLILCLLIFVCFSIRPLGLTFRSHIFGVVLGLGIFSLVQLVQAAWLSTLVGHDLYSAPYVAEAAGSCVALLVWGTYFALPEPKRRMILLPTTSPFFLWNRISEILGDAPGNVAVAGFTPDMLAPAEIEMLTLAISQEEATARERESADESYPPLLPLESHLPLAPYMPLPPPAARLPSVSEREFALSR